MCYCAKLMSTQPLNLILFYITNKVPLYKLGSTFVMIPKINKLYSILKRQLKGTLTESQRSIL